MPEPIPEAGAKRETLDPDALWWRVPITEPNGRTLELDTSSGWSLPDWQACAARYHALGAS